MPAVRSVDVAYPYVADMIRSVDWAECTLTDRHGEPIFLSAR